MYIREHGGHINYPGDNLISEIVSDIISGAISDTVPETLLIEWKPIRRSPTRGEEMSRTPSNVRTRSGRGVAVNERDLKRLRLMGRWYSLTAEHIVRSEQDDALWSPTLSSSQIPEAQAAFSRSVEAIKRRFRKLKAIEESPGIGVGPLVGTSFTPSGRTAYFVTRYGKTTAGLPWSIRPEINPNFAEHSWMAADIGMALESAGYRVLSERELSTGIDQHGDEITAPFSSEYRDSTGKITNKKPDVAVLHPNGNDYIAIEVERDTNRAVSVYEQKLSAYASNPAVKAVWYICASKTTAKRVAAGAQRVFKSPGAFPLRIMTIPNIDGYHFLDLAALSDRAKADLAPMRTAEGEFADDGLGA